MATTLREVVAYLKARGVDIEFKERPDGSLRITSIDGIKYAGSEGNNKAREAAGMEMSAAQKEQRRKAQPKAVEGLKLKEPALTARERERLRAENKRRRKVGLKSLSAKQARQAKRDDGNIREMLKRSASARFHAAGHAYRASILHDIDEIESDPILKETRQGVFIPGRVKFPKTLRALRAGAYGKLTISDRALYRCREIRYNFAPGATVSRDGSMTIEEADKLMEEILRSSWKDVKD